MQSDLHNSDLSLKVSVKEVELSVQSLSRFEQYRKMVEKNPWLQHLQDRLGLELN